MAPGSLIEAARHLCLGGGKRARPLLVKIFGDTLGVPETKLVDAAVAAELIHAASLLHDDVVDAGMFRRGKPTVNARWGNIVAVMSGDLLLSGALLRLSQRRRPARRERPGRPSSEMTRAAIAEVEARGNLELPLPQLRAIAEGKTGSLFGWCGKAAARPADDAERPRRFDAFGRRLGVAFQIADDIRDVTGTDAGKPQYADLPRAPPRCPCCWPAASDARLKARIADAWAFGAAHRREGARSSGTAVLVSGALEEATGADGTRRSTPRWTRSAIMLRTPAGDRAGGLGAHDRARHRAEGSGMKGYLWTHDATAPRPTPALHLAGWESVAVDAVGNVIEFWGFKRNQGRVWALLYLRDVALTAAEIEDELYLSKGGVSMLLRDLERWGVMLRVRSPGDTAWRYKAETDLLKMARRVIEEREFAFISRIRADLAEAKKLAQADHKTTKAQVQRLLAHGAARRGHREGLEALPQDLAPRRGHDVPGVRRLTLLSRAFHGRPPRHRHEGPRAGGHRHPPLLRVLHHPRRRGLRDLARAARLRRLHAARGPAGRGLRTWRSSTTSPAAGGAGAWPGSPTRRGR